MYICVPRMQILYNRIILYICFNMSNNMEKKTVIKQSNNVTNSLRDFTLYQEKFYMCIMAFLQDAIEFSFTKRDYNQLDLFRSDGNSIDIDIPLRYISKPREYPDVKASILKMVDKTVMFRYVDDMGESRIYKSSIFSADIPEKGDYKGIVKISMQKKVADYLIKIAKDARGVPIQYTKYTLQTAMSLKFLYSPKLYILMSSWRAKGSFYYSKEELYGFLSVDLKTAYPIFKRNILKKAHKELKEVADVYFEFQEVKEGKAVKGVNFTVYDRGEMNKDYQTKTESIKSILKLHFSFKEQDIQDIHHVFAEEAFNYGVVMQKLQYIKEYIEDPSNKIFDKVKYIKKSLEGVYNVQ